MNVSVIIPTFNRKAILHESLNVLARQSWPADRFEVIVVDDGSEDGTNEIAAAEYPYRLRYFRQENQGDAVARNTGAQQSRADILVFLDDDVFVAPAYLASLVPEHAVHENRIVVGTEHLWLSDLNPLDHASPATAGEAETLAPIPFAEVCSNNMSLRRASYLDVGMMEDLGFSGSSIWCDVDFAYRAFRRGFEFYRSPQALCWHRDYVASSLKNQSQRMREASYRSVTLFQKHPDLLPHLPMFADKTPIDWGEDSPPLIARKVARHVASSRAVVRVLEAMAHVLEKRRPSSPILSPFYRWIIGGHIYQGFREGLEASRPER